MIPFNIPPRLKASKEYVIDAVDSGALSGDGRYTKKCHEWLSARCETQKVLLTTSGTAALEMAARLCELEAGDEVILPSFTFSSTANAFVRERANLVFVDIDPKTMNVDPYEVEKAVTSRTRVIVVVHYAGVACSMDDILKIAERYGILVVEDAAQALMSTYKGRPLGSLGDFGCLSFHATKNYSMGEGGALLIKDPRHNEKAEILREKGTDRSKFLRGQVDKYTWVDYGSSYLPSELNAAYLYAQLEMADDINEDRISSWNAYYRLLSASPCSEMIELPYVPEYCSHNAHMFYIKARDVADRTALVQYLDRSGVSSCFHYVPLHTSSAGRRYGRFSGEDKFTTVESDRLLRLPMYYGLSKDNVEKITQAIENYYVGCV